MLHTKFNGNRPAGSGEEDFLRFLPYMSMAANLAMLPASHLQIFISLYLKAFIQNLVQNGSVVSEEIWFQSLYVNDLDLQYSHTFMKSISCLYLPTFRSQASIVSANSTVFTFSYRKA